MFSIRPYEATDSVEEITKLVNRAYAELAAMGFQYVGTWQTPEITLERIEGGICFLAVDGPTIIGTITVYEPNASDPCPVYRDASTFSFGQFGVDPDRRGEGVGRQLYLAAEEFALIRGARVVACDTAEGAIHLIALYRRWGFEIVGRQDWSSTNYVSVVMAKDVTGKQ